MGLFYNSKYRGVVVADENYGIQLTVPKTPGSKSNRVRFEPSKSITNIPSPLTLAICFLSSEKLANRLMVWICVNRVGTPPVTGTDHQSEGMLWALAT